MFSPLEQFKVSVFALFKFFSWGSTTYFFSFNVINVYFCIIFLFCLLFLYLPVFNFYLVPNIYQYLVESCYLFILKLMQQQISNLRSLIYFPLVFSIFLFVLISNLIGLLPYSYTVTGHIILTFCLGFSIFVGIVLLGFFNNKLYFLSLFVPTGVPGMLVPFLIYIEIVSYFIRPFSLSVRLFANMLAGHTLLSIISSFVFFVFSSKYLILFLFPFVFLLAIMVLEIAIAFIQSYVFVVLLCIYLNDIYSV